MDFARMETIGESVEKLTSDKVVTSGSFATEDESQDALLKILQRQRFFAIQREVDCWYFGGQPFQERPTGRIDFVLCPLRPALDAGWRNGVIGIECKASGKKIGPVFCQLLDYSRALFESQQTGALFALNAVFLWPEPTEMFGALQSIVTQNRVGIVEHIYNARYPDSESLRMKVGGTNIVRLQLVEGKLFHHQVVSGRKSGSR